MKKNFTIVELLVVIAVIGILAGLLLPALAGVKENGKLTQARSDCATIRTAILSFYNEYSYLPIDSSDSDTMIKTDGSADATGNGKVTAPAEKVELADSTEYVKFFDRLCMTKLAGSEDSTFNKKKITFLSPSGKYSNASNTEWSFRDPWDRPYLIMLDTNYDGKIVNASQSFGLQDNTLVDRVGVVSFGRSDTGGFNANMAAFSWK